MEEFLDTCHHASCDDICLMEGFWRGLNGDIRFIMPREDPHWSLKDYISGRCKFTFKYIIVVTAWFFSSFCNISYGKTLRPTCEREKDKLKLRINTGLLCAKTQFQISYSMHKNSCEAPNYFTALYGAYCTDVLVEDFQTQSWLTFHLTDQTHTHI